MNRKIVILLLILIGAGAVWWSTRHAMTEAPIATAKPPEEEGIKITHDPGGNVVLHVTDELQGNVGITVAKPDIAEYSPEVKAYGRVLDAAPLSAALGELLAQRIAADYSRREFERMKLLKGQNNASERAFQTAEEAYVRSEAAFKLGLAKIRPVWGEKIAEQLGRIFQSEAREPENDPLLSGLAAGKSSLVRVDLPAGQEIDSSRIKTARMVPSGANEAFVEANYLGLAPNVDPQTQGQGHFFLVSSNAAHLLPGAAVTAFIQLAEQPIPGVIVPLPAVVRAEGAAWVYVMGADSDSFTRTEIALDRPVEKGWFVSTNISSTNYLVTIGAQSLLSQETKPAGGPD